MYLLVYEALVKKDPYILQYGYCDGNGSREGAAVAIIRSGWTMSKRTSDLGMTLYKAR